MSAIQTVSTVDDVARALGYPPAKSPTPLEQARANCARLSKQPVEPMPGGHRPDDKGKAARGNARLLEAVSQPFTEADAEALLRRELPELCSVWVRREYRAFTQTTRYTVFADHQNLHADGHIASGDDLLETTWRVIRSYLANPLGRESQPNADELRREVYCDDGEATKGTLEVEPDQSARTRAATEAKFGNGGGR